MLRVPSDKQIEAAAKAMYDADINPIGMNHYRLLAKAAAPYLQFPLELPTDAEVNAASEKWINYQSWLSVLCQFIGNRNASLLPKPVDPLRDVIEKAFQQLHDYSGSQDYHRMVNCAKTYMLVALNEVK